MAYTKDLDAVLLVSAVLKRLGGGKVDSFPERLRSQKTQYLAQVFGISPGYRFSLYLRGPYAPALAADLFALESENITDGSERFIPEELENRFSVAHKFIEGKSVRELELISTLHWLETVGNLNEKDASIKLKELKSATDTEVEATRSEVEKLCKLSVN